MKIRFFGIMAAFMVILMAPLVSQAKGPPKELAVDTAQANDDMAAQRAMIAQYDAWVAQATAEIDAVNVNHVIVTNQVYTTHELTAIANTLPGTHNDSGHIDYIVKLPGASGTTTVDEGLLFQLGAGVGTTYSVGDKIPGAVLMWNPTDNVVFLKTSCGGTIPIEPNSIVAFGDIVMNGNNAVEGTAPTTSTHCSTTCDPGFWCCANVTNGQATCTCVRNTVQNPTCLSGGVGSRSCEYDIKPKAIAPATQENQ